MPKDKLHKLYPEVRESGSLHAAMQSALAAIGSPLVAMPTEQPFPLAYARIEHGPRFSQTYIAAEERLFLPDFWSHGVHFAMGKTRDLPATASAIHDWLTIENISTAELVQRYPWIEPSARAAAFEAGDEVEWTWRHMLESTRHTEQTRAAIHRASQEPALRCLFPYTSMFTLCFSRCTGYPYTRGILSISPAGEGRYAVGTPAEDPTNSHDLETAIALVLASLPPDCGPARRGTADDL